jgi:F-type H+-transporting ATPase subunit epsilon
MADDAIALEIVTQDGVVLARNVSGFTAPSEGGEFGVLPGHSPLLAALRTGIVSYTFEGTEERVAVGSGFVEVMNDKAVLLTDHFSRKDEVDPVRARLDLKDADEALEHFKGEPGSSEYLELMSKELWAAARLTLYGDPPPPIVRTHSEVLSAAPVALVEEDDAAAEANDAGPSTH